MAIECGIITVMFAIMAVGFFIKKRKLWAFATIPLALVPFVESMLDFVFASAIPAEQAPFIRIVGLLIAVAVSCVWIGCVAVGMKSKSKRITYIGIAYTYNVLLAAILIYNILKEYVM